MDFYEALSDPWIPAFHSMGQYPYDPKRGINRPVAPDYRLNFNTRYSAVEKVDRSDSVLVEIKRP